MENISRSRIAFSPPGSAITIVLVGVIVVATLYFAREVLVPIALALLLSFVLAPLVQLLRRWYLPHSGAAEWGQVRLSQMDRVAGHSDPASRSSTGPALQVQANARRDPENRYCARRAAIRFDLR